MISISKDGNKIFVSGYGNTYSVDADTPAINQYGNETGWTVGEEFERGTLYAHDDNVHGDSHGMHGALVVSCT